MSQGNIHELFLFLQRKVSLLKWSLYALSISQFSSIKSSEKAMAPHSGCPILENPRDGGAWWAAVHGVTQSRTQLKRLSSSSSSIKSHPFSKNKSVCLVAQSCPTLSNPVDCSPPGSSVHEILQARILEWVAISFSRGSSWPRDRTQIESALQVHYLPSEPPFQ